MEGLIWLLVFAGFLYFMMRFGYAYGWYFALVWAPFYNFFVSRGRR